MSVKSMKPKVGEAKLELWTGTPYYTEKHSIADPRGGRIPGSQFGHTLEGKCFGRTLQWITGHAWPVYEICLFGTQKLLYAYEDNVNDVTRKYFPKTTARERITISFCWIGTVVSCERTSKHCGHVIWDMFDRSTLLRPSSDKKDMLRELAEIDIVTSEGTCHGQPRMVSNHLDYKHKPYP